MLQKRRFSYARLTMYDDGATLSVSGRRQQGLEDLAFIGPAKQSFRVPQGPIAVHRTASRSPQTRKSAPRPPPGWERPA